jgi:sugar lactone lactonase YvrE
MAPTDGTTVACVSGEAVWPLSWYWRHLPTWWSLPRAGLRPALVVCDPVDEMEVKALLGPGYSRDRIPLRTWWLMYEELPTIGEYLRYFFTRIPWQPVGSTDVLVFRRTGDVPPASRPADVPGALAEALNLGSAEVVGEGWLAEVRGVAVGDGPIAIADAALSRVTIVDVDDSLVELPLDEELSQPEAVAWRTAERLLVADTWNHRVLDVDTESGDWTELPPPDEGWYGPRAVAVSEHGRVVVADTGHKRLVVYDSLLQLSHVIDELQHGDRLDEPGGVAWVDHDSVLVCDTGNHRMLVVSLNGSVETEVQMPDAWEDYYSRPQVAVIAADHWVVSDTPAGVLWIVERGRVDRQLVADEMQPTGLAWEDGVLVVGDLDGRVWRLEVEHGSP